MIRVDPADSSTASRTFSTAARVLMALKLDGPLLVGLGLLVLYGLAVLYSASGESWSMVFRATVRLGIGATAMVLLAQVRPSQLRKVALPLWIVGVVLLIVVDVLGVIGKGAQRWLDLGFVRFQPSEIMKLAVPMLCAAWLHERPVPPSPASLGMLALIILVPAALTAAQPDLGTAILITIAGALLLILAGLSVWFMAGAAAMAGGLAWVGWQYLLHDYQRQRVLTFLDPQTDPLGSGYHIIQSQIAIGSGGVFGKGYMNGSQSQLEYLPERHTDFIYAVIGEELGLVGALAILACFGVIAWRGMRIALRAQDAFGTYVALGLTTMIVVQAFVNISVVLGLLPTKGIPLPLVSHGGSSLLVNLLGMGILLNISQHETVDE
jgi:rod shape determining protein RodA